MPTLHQFTFEMPSGGITLTSIVTGVFTAVMCWRLLRDTAQTSWMVQLMACGITLAFTWFVAMLVAGLHVPSSH